ncbi:MAG: ABC transporter permease [Candidatus Caenarcaniphilales bacterium]|nr:ABC transporter permease [Candidatus Caenarcaniphilales bacterium]
MIKSPLQIQKNVLFALFIREIKTRFGEYKLGYFWAVVEPLTQVLFFVFIWSILGRTSFNGVHSSVFLVTSVVPWFCFANCISRSNSAIEANRVLFVYKNVQPTDTVFNRVCLEFLIHLVVYVIMLLGLLLFGFDVSINDPFMHLLAWMVLFAYSLGFGFLTCLFSTTFKSASSIVGVIKRVLYFSSGVFFPLSSLPTQVQNFIKWNPLLQLIEFLRASYFESFSIDNEFILYTSFISLIILFYGFYLFRRYQLALKRM